MAEGRGTVRGSPAVIKVARLSIHTDDADKVLNEVRAYERLADLQGQCLPRLEGAGTFGENGVFLAVSGGERAVRSELLRGQVDVLALPAATRRAALESLRQIHDQGVLHGSAFGLSLFLRENKGASPHALWADFGASSIIPGMNRHSAAAQDEAFTAALYLGLPEWNHVHLLLPAAKRLRDASPHDGSTRSHELPIPMLLPAVSRKSVRFYDLVSCSHLGDVTHGTVHGRLAVIKTACLHTQPDAALEIAREVTAYRRLQHLQGACIPELVGAGCLDRGSVAFIATTDAGISVEDLGDQDDYPALHERLLTAKERAAALEALSRIHDGGVLHGDAGMYNLMIQGAEDARPRQMLWIDFGTSKIVPGLSRRSAAAGYDLGMALDALGDAAWAHKCRRRELAHRRQMEGSVR